MALSNLGNEPRRELTESAVGIAATIAWLGASFLIAKLLDPYYVNAPHDYSPPWAITISFFTAFIAVLGPLLLFGIVHITHALGEEVCDWLKALRIDPRPRRRY